jgi:multidrug efflux pump subunit AcrA (membrane-fusion protein)
MSGTQAPAAALASLLAVACSGGTQAPPARMASAAAPEVVVANAPAATTPVESSLLLPGKLRPDTTIADLQALYGDGRSWSARFR